MGIAANMDIGHKRVSLVTEKYLNQGAYKY